jgi:hypothetical protein
MYISHLSINVKVKVAVFSGRRVGYTTKARTPDTKIGDKNEIIVTKLLVKSTVVTGMRSAPMYKETSSGV